MNKLGYDAMVSLVQSILMKKVIVSFSYRAQLLSPTVNNATITDYKTCVWKFYYEFH